LLSQQPTANSQQPTANSQQPTANSQQPTANSQQPTANSQQLALLKKHFANCFDKHGNFIAAKLQEIVHDSGVALSKEGYSLNWLGKSYARLLANENIRTRLVADSAHNQNPENSRSQNLLIKGDNLEVLKHLMGAYSEQVKMIYIDPPYNTGSDGFVYQDDRKFSVEQLSSLAGIDEDEAKRILEFTSSSSKSHSAWLTFMYPRLYLARQLLRDDGVIFISIDDNEQAQLKVLCDEVFGEESFEGHIHWRRRHNQPNDKTKMIGLVAEHVLSYSKNKDFFKKSGVGKVDLTGDFANADNDPRGDWASKPWKVGSDQSGSRYVIKNPNNGKNYDEAWMGEELTYLALLKDSRIIFPRNGDGFPRKKYFRFEREAEGQCATNWWKHEEFGHNQGANDAVTAMFGIKNIFSNPKPTALIRGFVQVSNAKSNDIILDFFAGSGTTAHAVMELNAEDGDNRQFICVQIDESTDAKSEAYKAGYQTIFDITQARISKAAAKIKDTLSQSATLTPTPLPKGEGLKAERELDLGFKIFATQPMFDKYLDTPESLTENLELFDVKTLSQPDRHSLMLTWAVRDGIKLGTPLSPVSLGGYTAYAAEKILYFVEPDISLTAVVALLEQLDNNPAFAPSRLVVLGYLLDSKTQREMSEAVKGYNNRKGIELTLDIRYN
jgi:adenine-specific DNA-methyltransferase